MSFSASAESALSPDIPRHTLDLAVIPALRERSDLPIIVDPSHATGMRSRVPSMAKASIAAGANGLMLEIHPDPDHAMSDGFQTLSIHQFSNLMNDLKKIAPQLGGMCNPL